jgi:hypothetical protein
LWEMRQLTLRRLPLSRWRGRARRRLIRLPAATRGQRNGNSQDHQGLFHDCILSWRGWQLISCTIEASCPH